MQDPPKILSEKYFPRWTLGPLLILQCFLAHRGGFFSPLKVLHIVVYFLLERLTMEVLLQDGEQLSSLIKLGMNRDIAYGTFDWVFDLGRVFQSSSMTLSDSF